MKYGLYGIFGVYNFGCEAIVRGTVKFLEDLDSEAEIFYFSHNYDYDNKVLKDLNLTIIDIKENRLSFFKRCINKICRIFNIEFLYSSVDYRLIVNKCDYMVSIGGDIYTIPKVLRDKSRYTYINNLVEIGKKVLRSNKQILIYGASIGPFGNYDKAVKYYYKNLSKYKLILCREYRTLEYLKSIGINNCYFLPDPAFNAKSIEKSDKKEKKYIGINLSPISIKELYGKISNENIQLFSKIINKIYEEYKIKILLVPHVISQSVDDDDLRFLKQIYNNLDYKTKQNVCFSSHENGFLGTKEELKQCYFVIAARMHCGINAICENIPTLFLSYSDKSKGMCNYIYNTDEWVVDIRNNDFEEELFIKLASMYKQLKQLNTYLINRNEEINSDYTNYLKKVKDDTWK